MSKSEIIPAEIIYQRPDGVFIHSDIGVRCADNLSDEEWRKYLHDCLDEWLDESRGTGVFYIGDRNHHYAG